MDCRDTGKHIGVVMTDWGKKPRWFTLWARIAVVVVFGLVAISTGSTMASRVDLQSDAMVSVPQVVGHSGVIPKSAPATPPPDEPSPTVPPPDEPSPTVPPPDEPALPVACEPAVDLPVVPTPEPGNTESIAVVPEPIQFEGEVCIEAVRIMTVSAAAGGIPTQLILQVAGSIRGATSAQVFAVDDHGQRWLVCVIELGNQGVSFRADLEGQLPSGTVHWLVLFA